METSYAERRTAFLFGPQAVSFNEEAARLLWKTLRQGQSQKWIFDTISELHTHWPTLSQSVSGLQGLQNGDALLRELQTWVQTGALDSTKFPLPNILLTPLVVALQLSHYFKYLEAKQPDDEDRHHAHISTLRDAEAVGFCTGLLTAIAVSSAKDDRQLREYGSVAIRLAMLAGAVVDAQDMSGQSDDEAGSFSVAWSSPAAGEEMRQSLKKYPDVSSLSSILADSGCS